MLVVLVAPVLRLMLEAVSGSGAGMSGASAIHMNVFGLHPVVGGHQPAADRVDARGHALPSHHAVPFMLAGPARHWQPAVGSWAPGHLGPHAVADVALGVGGDQVVVYQAPFTGRLVQLGNGLGLEHREQAVE